MLITGLNNDVDVPQTAIYADPWILSAVALALIIRLVNLGAAALWLDETFTASWAQLPWRHMLQSVLRDNHLPLYPALMKAWSSVAGVSPWALRLPSAICSWAMVPLIAALAWTLLGSVQARWAAWLAALSPYLLQHAQDARMYALLGVLSAMSMLQLAHFITGKSKHLGFWFIAVNTALLATHYYAVFLIAAQALVLTVLRLRRWRSWISGMAASCAMVVLAFLAAKYLAYPQAGGHYNFGWVAFPGLIWSLISGYALTPSSAELHTVGLRAAVKYLPIAIVLLGALIVIALAALRSTSRDALWLLLSVLTIVILSPFVMALFYDVAINPRYAMAAVPALTVMLAAGCARAAQSRLAMAAPAALIVCTIIASVWHLGDPGHGREDVYNAAQWLNANVPADEEILVTSEEMATLARFHWPSRRLLVYPPKKVVAGKSNAEQIAANLPFSGRERIVYIFGREWLSDPDGALRAALKAEYDSCPGTAVRGIQVLCFKKRRG